MRRQIEQCNTRPAVSAFSSDLYFYLPHQYEHRNLVFARTPQIKGETFKLRPKSSQI